MPLLLVPLRDVLEGEDQTFSQEKPSLTVLPLFALQNKSRLHHLSEFNVKHPQGGDSVSSDCFLHCCLNTVVGLGWLLQVNSGKRRTRQTLEADRFRPRRDLFRRLALEELLETATRSKEELVCPLDFPSLFVTRRTEPRPPFFETFRRGLRLDLGLQPVHGQSESLPLYFPPIAEPFRLYTDHAGDERDRAGGAVFPGGSPSQISKERSLKSLLSSLRAMSIKA